LKQNDLLARELRSSFRDAGLSVVSFVSSPGAGKTTLLQKLLTELHKEMNVAALVGDLATENDAARLARSGAPVRQIVTGTVCHLDAEMVRKALVDWRLDQIDLLLIENVGNMVCPSSYDLGEDLRFVLMSVTEGEDKPLKYPTIFNTADVAVITKMDLAAAAEFDLATAEQNIQSVRPGMPVLRVSAKTEDGLEDLLGFIKTVRPAPDEISSCRPLLPLGGGARVEGLADSLSLHPNPLASGEEKENERSSVAAAS
jgi:hydrogenase nickel incorporation protein HypB